MSVRLILFGLPRRVAMHTGPIALALITLAAAQTALACERDSGAARLPGESQAEFEERDREVFHDNSVIQRYLREQDALAKARTVYIARVVSTPSPTRPGSNIVLPAATVHPVRPIKGALPRARRTLIDLSWSGECFDRGDGRASYGKIGSLVIVFEGLPTSTNRPNGIDSLLATDVRSSELLDALA